VTLPLLLTGKKAFLTTESSKGGERVVALHCVGQMALALPPPHTEIDALPYVDTQFNKPEVRKLVNSLIEEEKKTFKPEQDYLAQWPLHEPDFEVCPAGRLPCERRNVSQLPVSVAGSSGAPR
jgi:hypothetical protein